MDDVDERIAAVLPSLDRLGKVVAFDIGESSIKIDARQAPARIVDDEDLDAECTIKISQANLVKLLDGQLDPMLGYTLGKIKVVGSLGIAMKLIGALG